MKILIENLTFETIIGILEYERITPQIVSIDCEIEYPYSTDHFINYAEVAKMIEEEMNSKKFFLIEEALQTLAISLKQTFSSIKALTLTIRKPNILPNCTVGVQNHFNF